MICTFGDLTDVTWWRELSLPVRAVDPAERRAAAGDVRLRRVAVARTPPRRRRTTTSWRRCRSTKARAKIVELLAAVRRSDRRAAADHAPGEVLREGRPAARDRDEPAVVHQDDGLQGGAAGAADASCTWHPDYMRHRYENWVNGLTGDWCVSRQRFFGVPFPVWYPVRADGTVDYARPIAAGGSRGCRSIRPPTCPTATTAEQRDQPGGFTGDPDVMDTWATSSLTPQIAGGWLDDPALFAARLPDGRAAAGARHHPHVALRHRAARRARARLAAVDATRPSPGWVLDPDRKKMSKSKGNVVTPMGLLEEHGSDGVRYWAASGRPGTDTAFDPAQMKVGRRLAIKLLNAAQFALLQAEPRGADHRAARPRHADACWRGWWTNRPAHLEAYDYARVLERVEAFFWSLLRRLPGAGEVAPLRRLRSRGRGQRQQRHAGGACPRCCGCSRRTCRS